jgi:bifunctional UDP-N-acetylglucosamine pyrophosphorylase/glucosamine-1-phosphate N-acetyltransferase
MAAKGRPLTVLALAAGQGKRMASKRIKLLHLVAGRPMVIYVLDAARSLGPSRIITVIGHQGEQVREAVADHTDRLVTQTERRGTGHAVVQAAKELRRSGAGTVLILNGDLPTLLPATLRRVVTKHRRSGAALTLVTCEVPDPSGYGRIVRDARGNVQSIVEHRDATREQRKIHEINCGIYCAETSKLLRVLKGLRPDNAQGEYYLTDAVHELLGRGERVIAHVHPDAEEVLGVNSRAELARAGATLYARKAAALQKSGVTLLDAARTWIDPRARIGKDTILYPDVIIEGPSVIGEDCVIRPGSRLVDTVVGRGVEIKDHSVLTESRVGDGAAVGPFAHLRPGSVLGTGVKVGNFVEVKKAHLKPGAKASHLSYLGDAEIGAGSNIGAGTITCNYDGKVKHRTTLGRGVFIGSDTQLVAPVTVGDGAYVGAGTTVTRDVPPGALAVGRAPQNNIEGWVARKKSRESGKKSKKPTRSGG